MHEQQPPATAFSAECDCHAVQTDHTSLRCSYKSTILGPPPTSSTAGSCCRATQREKKAARQRKLGAEASGGAPAKMHFEGRKPGPCQAALPASP